MPGNSSIFWNESWASCTRSVAKQHILHNANKEANSGSWELYRSSMSARHVRKRPIKLQELFKLWQRFQPQLWLWLPAWPGSFRSKASTMEKCVQRRLMLWYSGACPGTCRGKHKSDTGILLNRHSLGRHSLRCLRSLDLFTLVAGTLLYLGFGLPWAFSLIYSIFLY